MRRVFFSFHYMADIWRVNQVRNAWLISHGQSRPPFADGSLREKAATRDEAALRRMIDHALKETSVTVVLIGSQTAERPYVRYEIEQSLVRGHGLLGLYIHQLRDARGQTARKGPNPLDRITLPGLSRPLSLVFETYDWVDDDGCTNLGRWIEAAALRGIPGVQLAGKVFRPGGHGHHDRCHKPESDVEALGFQG